MLFNKQLDCTWVSRLAQLKLVTKSIFRVSNSVVLGSELA